MQVKRLIELLGKENPEAEVLMPLSDGMGDGDTQYSPLVGFEVAVFEQPKGEVWKDPHHPATWTVKDGVPAIIVWPEGD